MKIENLATLVSDKCEGRNLCSNTYLSTENMLPNLGGYTQASSLPDFKVTRFIPGDILLSNIRPYFKKMVFADLYGGCSNDVVCIRANPSICLPKYLYYALSTDTFFDYYTSTCKGTKMPRGDKEMLLKYQIPVPEFAIQRHIVGTRR